MTALIHSLIVIIAVILAVASIQRFRRNGREPLLPEAAYGTANGPYDEDTRRRIDDAIALRMHLIPTIPGRWYDREGEIWTLGDDHRWTDPKGDTRGPEWTPLLGLFAPWSPVPPQTTSSPTAGGA